MKRTVHRNFWNRATLPTLVALATLFGRPSAPMAEDEGAPDQFLPFDRREDVLPGGTGILVIHGNPGSGAAILVSFAGGESALPPTHRGLARIAAALLAAGPADRPGAACDSAVGSLGGRLATRATADAVELTLEVPPENLVAALELVAAIVSAPALPEALFDSEKARITAELSQPRSAEDRAGAALAGILYDRHPYAYTPTPEGVAALTRADLLAYREERLGALDATVVVAGEVGDDEVILRAARAAFGNLPKGGVGDQRRSVPPPQTRRRVFLLHDPGAQDAAVVTGNIGIRWSDPDLFAGILVEEILGRPEGGRIPTALREAGLSAARASVSLAPRRDVGLFTVSIAAGAAEIDSVAAVLLGSLDRVRHDPIMAGEVETAAAARSAAHGEAIGTALGLARETLEFDLAERDSRASRDAGEVLAAISTIDVSRSARRMIRSYSAPLVFSGDGERIGPRVVRFGELVWCDANGAPLPPERRPAGAADMVPPSRSRLPSYGASRRKTTTPAAEVRTTYPDTAGASTKAGEAAPAAPGSGEPAGDGVAIPEDSLPADSSGADSASIEVRDLGATPPDSSLAAPADEADTLGWDQEEGLEAAPFDSAAPDSGPQDRR